MTQQEMILEHLKSGKEITGIDALNLFGCFRLASRISDLKKLGNPIEVRMIKRNGKSYASYKLGGTNE